MLDTTQALPKWRPCAGCPRVAHGDTELYHCPDCASTYTDNTPRRLAVGIGVGTLLAADLAQRLTGSWWAPVGVGLCGLFALLLYACCYVASEADQAREDAERQANADEGDGGCLGGA